MGIARISSDVQKAHSSKEQFRECHVFGQFVVRFGLMAFGGMSVWARWPANPTKNTTKALHNSAFTHADFLSNIGLVHQAARKVA
jgi:hypothetical protein